MELPLSLSLSRSLSLSPGYDEYRLLLLPLLLRWCSPPLLHESRLLLYLLADCLLPSFEYRSALNSLRDRFDEDSGGLRYPEATAEDRPLLLLLLLLPE